MRTTSILRLAFIALNTAGLFSFAAAQTAVTPSTSTPPTVEAPATKGLKHHHHPDFLNEIALTQAQKTQIEQIKSSGSDKKAIKKEIKALLTTTQKEQLKSLKAQWKASHPKQNTTTGLQPDEEPASAV